MLKKFKNILGLENLTDPSPSEPLISIKKFLHIWKEDNRIIRSALQFEFM